MRGLIDDGLVGSLYSSMAQFDIAFVWFGHDLALIDIVVQYC